MKIIITHFISLSISLLLLLQVSLAQENNSYVLKKNPFVKPEISNLNVNSNDSFDVEENNLILKGTLISDDSSSIANINGEMIIIGQKINNYELISVEIGSAILRANGLEKRLVISDKYREIR